MAIDSERMEPMDSEQDVEDVYEVERIIDMRVEEGEVLYRVRWKNYCSDDDTWEPEAHLEDCREVLLAFKNSMADIKVKKEPEAKKTMKLLPTKSDVFDADSESDGDKDHPSEVPPKKKKKIKEEDLSPREMTKKKKDKLREDGRPLPAPDTDEDEDEEKDHPLSSPIKEKRTEPRIQLVDSDEDEDDSVPSKKHKKVKTKEGGRQKKGEEGKKKRGKRERKIETSEDEAAAPLEEELSDGPSESHMDTSASTDTPFNSAEKTQLDKYKQKKGKVEVKLQGVQDKKKKKSDSSLKESSLQKLKSLTSKNKDEAAPHSDSSDSSTLHKKSKSKGQESTSASSKAPSSATSSSSSSSSVAASTTKGKEDELIKEEVLGQKDASGSTNLFEKFLLNCEAKDRVPRRQPAHQPPAEKSGSKPAKVVGKIEKIPKQNKDSPTQKPDFKKMEKTKQSDASRSGQSHGFSLDSDERESDELAVKQRPGEERRERPEETQRSSWERRTPTDDRRRKREDSEPRLFMACDDMQDTPDPLEGADKSDKVQATLSLGMDLNLDWMTLDDFQKHLNGEDEMISGPPLSPSELRDAVKSGHYMTVKLALNSKEEYNLDQEMTKLYMGTRRQGNLTLEALRTLFYLVTSPLQDYKVASNLCKAALTKKEVLEDKKMSPLKQAYTVGDMKTFEGERSLIEERSSSDAFRITSNLESTLAEEGIPRLKYLDDLYGDKPPGPSATNDTEQLTLRELEHVHKREEEVSDSNVAACELAAMERNEDPQQVEGEEMPDGTGGLSANLSFNLVNCGSTKNAEMALPNQGEEEGVFNKPQSPEEPSHPSEEAENVMAAQSDGTDEVLKSCTKRIAKARLHRHRRALERKIPMRSSLRPRKRVLTTKFLMEDEEKKEPSKKHFCLYCKMAFSQLEKHLEKRHAEETDVAHAIHFPKGSKVRQSLLDQIRNKGDYAQKCEVVRGGAAETAAKQAKNPNVSVRDSLPCRHCFAFFRNTDLWKHEQSCKVSKGFEQSSETTGKSGATEAAARVLPDPEFLTEGCRDIIDIMNQDDVSKQIRNDPLICKYGNSLSVKYDCDKSQFAHIAQRMRELGRFVLAVNELDNNVKYLHEICVPSRFELAVEGAKKMGAVDQTSSQFKTVSLVSKIGYALKRAAEIAFGDSRMMEDSETENKLKKFLHLLDTKWSTSFSRKTLTSSVKREIKKVDLDKSTVTEDLIKLRRFIAGEEEEARKELKEGPSLSTWKKLSEATLADICLFNRGRVGNIGRMLLHTYTHKKQKGAFVPSADQVKKNTKLELHLGAQFTRLELEGQYGRNTLVLLTERMVSSVDLLIEHREAAGVSKTNPYLFARTEGPSFIRGLDCFRRAAMECGVKNPEALLSSCLREQIACCWQLMSLSEHESKQVASLLGISGEDCCRLPEHTSQLEEISQQLLKLDRTLSASPPTSVRDGTAQKSALKRRPWADKEQAAVKRYLCEFITNMKVPGKKECNACIAAEPDLSGRSWTDVKNYVHNTLQTMRRRNNLQYAEGNLNRSPRNRIRTPKKPLEDPHLCNMTTVHPDHLRESADCLMPMAPAMDLSESAENFSQDMNPTYASLCSTSTNIAHDTQPLISSFTALNATDTQVVPTFTPRNTTNALMSEAYSSESSIIMSMSPYAHSAMPPPMYAPQDPLSSPMIPSFSTFSAPSTSVMPTFTTLNSPSSPLLPSFSTVHRSPPMVSSFTPLNHPDASVYDDNPPRVPTTAQVVPTAHRPGASERTLHVLGSAAQSDAAAATEKPQKRIKRLWSEEEQAAVRRQFGDFCKLVKVPGKRDCDACLAAEPALNSRTWREVKYFVHNSIQSMRKKGQPVHTKQCEGPEPETHHPSVEWDGPVYLSFDDLRRHSSLVERYLTLPWPDVSGMSLSMLAAAGGHDDILRLLIRKGVRVNSRQKNGTTALMHAAEKNFLTTVAILLEAGSYVNAQTLGGETALMKACKRGNADVVRLLLENGADCNILSKHKNTAMYFAKLSNNLIVCDLVKDHINILSSVAEDTIRAYFESHLVLLEAVFPLACHRLCESPDFSLEFGFKSQPQPEGSGILLFIFHANFLSEITARLSGPCSVHAVVLNDKFQLPIFLDSHFIYSFSPIPGINKLFIRLAEAPSAKVKLLICAYRVQLQ